MIRGCPYVTGVSGGAGMAIFMMFIATVLIICVCVIIRRRHASKVKSEGGR